MSSPEGSPGELIELLTTEALYMQTCTSLYQTVKIQEMAEKKMLSSLYFCLQPSLLPQ